MSYTSTYVKSLFQQLAIMLGATFASLTSYFTLTARCYKIVFVATTLLPNQRPLMKHFFSGMLVRRSNDMGFSSHNRDNYNNLKFHKNNH